jgi:hypothetical protein
LLPRMRAAGFLAFHPPFVYHYYANASK